MANTIKGIVLGVRPTETVAGKDPSRPLMKRRVMIDCTRRDPYTGERSEFENKPVLEFTGDKCAELDKCKVGDVVEIAFTIEGRTYIEKGTGQPRNYTGIRAYALDVIKRADAPIQQPVTMANPNDVVVPF